MQITKRLNGVMVTPVAPCDMSARGWDDVRNNRAFPVEYDSWDEIDQRNYERGRLRASGAYLVYRRVPAKEPWDIVTRTNGLRLVPPSADKTRANRARLRRQRLAREAAQ
jgi:hypothetical protein